VISQDIEEQVATDYSIITTWIWRLQPLWVREISRIHIEFLFRKFAAIESKEKGPPNFKVRIHLEQFKKPNLVCLHEMEKDLILWNPKLCEQHLEESKFAGREHRCQNHNPGVHMCTQIFAGKKETTYANGGDNNKTETMHL